MSEDVSPPVTPLQFEKAEYSASQPPAATCAVCKGQLTETYYTVNRAVICDQCLGQFQAFLAGGSRVKRVLAATVLGLLGGLAGAAVWYAVRKITNYELGIIAIALGLMVGVAVRKGSKGRGGWFYQTLAILLTYCCVSAQYIPDLFEAMTKNAGERHAAAAPPGINPAAGNAHNKVAADKVAAKNAAAEEPEPADAAAPEPGIFKLMLAVALLLIISLSLPIVIGLHNPIGLLIVAFALYEAWKINKGSAIRVAGPFQLAQPAGSAAAGG